MHFIYFIATWVVYNFQYIFKVIFAFLSWIDYVFSTYLLEPIQNNEISSQNSRQTTYTLLIPKVSIFVRRITRGLCSIKLVYLETPIILIKRNDVCAAPFKIHFTTTTTTSSSHQQHQSAGPTPLTQKWRRIRILTDEKRDLCQGHTRTHFLVPARVRHWSKKKVME